MIQRIVLNSSNTMIKIIGTQKLSLCLSNQRLCLYYSDRKREVKFILFRHRDYVQVDPTRD
jgi:hypothetical protein